MVHPLLLSAALALPSLSAPQDGPPGLQELPGGRTVIGLTHDQIEEFLEEHEQLRDYARTFDSENTGSRQLRVEIDPFWLMTTEVTNEQYLQFVRATGYEPPVEWAGPALDVARVAFLDAEAEKFREAKEAGKRYTRKTFGPDESKSWWSKNWQEVEWAMPAEIALRPVVYIDYDDVLAYSMWAGLRPMGELEYQHAARGKTEQLFPWGSEWEDGKFAATLELRSVNHAHDVGSFPAGASAQGLFDLAGNVYEWTSGRYIGHDGYKQGKYEFGKGSDKKTISHPNQFDSNRRVSVGGCYQTPWATARCTHRRATEKSQKTNALGFRCAASPAPGQDIAAMRDRFVLRNSDYRASGVTFSPESALAIDRWETIPSAQAEKAPEGYAVISSYDYLIFVPREQLDYSQDTDLARQSLLEPQQLGFLSTKMPILEPALPAGDYIIAFRGKGKARRDSKEEEEEGEDQGRLIQETNGLPLEEVIDIKENLLLFIDSTTGEIAASVVASPKFEKIKELPKAEFFPEKVWVDGPDDEKVQERQKWMRIPITVLTKVRKRALRVDLNLLLEPEAQALEDWRGAEMVDK